MIAAGPGSLLSAIGFWAGDQEHPLRAVGFFLGGTTGSIMVFWFARLLLGGSLGLGR